MISSVLKMFATDLKAYGLTSACARAVRVARVRKTEKNLDFLTVSPAANAHRTFLQPTDIYFPFSHRWYLSTAFSRIERLEAARHAYSFIDRVFSPTEIQELSRSGKSLWRTELEGHSFEISLMFGNHNLYEGALSAVFRVDAKPVGVMSFSMVDGGLLGVEPGPQLLLCRNQTTSDRWYQKPLQDAFKHIALPYMMLAAVAGIGKAMGRDRIFAITEDAHPHADPASIEIMRGSYSQFWEKYQATPLKPGIVIMNVPLESTPLDQVAGKHRRRAKGRREVMDAIFTAVQDSLKPVANLSLPVNMAAAANSAQATGAASLVAAAIAACDLILPMAQERLPLLAHAIGTQLVA